MAVEFGVVGFSLFAILYVVILEGDAFLLKVALCAFAHAAPFGAVHDDAPRAGGGYVFERLEGFDGDAFVGVELEGDGFRLRGLRRPITEMHVAFGVGPFVDFGRGGAVMSS